MVWWLNVGCWLLFHDCLPLVVGCWLLCVWLYVGDGWIDGYGVLVMCGGMLMIGCRRLSIAIWLMSV